MSDGENKKCRVFNFSQQLLTASWPFSIPSPGTAAALLPLLLLSLFACLCVLLGFHFLCLHPRTFSSSLRPRAPARKGWVGKKRKWESSKSHSLLQHPCLPTHNAVLRFVQLPRSLLVCMYTSAQPAAPHLLLIAQQKAAGCRYFGKGNPEQCYFAANSLLPWLLQRKVCRDSQTERCLSMPQTRD